MRDVAGLRDSAERARRNRPGDLKMVVITPELAEQIADVVDAAPRNRACHALPEKVALPPDVEVCGECEACRFNAALARLDGTEAL